MRVLMICPELPRAGLPGAMAPAARQFNSLRKLGLTIDVVDLRGIQKLKYLQAIPKIRRLARGADLIHAHFGYCGWLAQLALALLPSRPPIVVSFMGDDLIGTPYNADGDLEWFSKLMVKANRVLARQLDQVIVKSQEMADVVAPAPSTIIPNGIDTGEFRPSDRDEARRQLELPEARKMVLFPGNPANPRKGYQLASAAVDIASRRLGEPIDLLPLWRVDPSRVALYMSACDVLLMTSLIEGSPNVVKEAMACDTAIIGVEVGDVPQLLAGVSGSAICERDPQVIGQHLFAWLSQPGSINSRHALLRRGLDLETVARRVIAVYEQALGRAVSLPPACPSNDSQAHANSPPTSVSV